MPQVKSIASFEDLLGRLGTLAPDQKCTVIGIDGMSQVGKTPLAKQLSEQMGAGLISLDDYLNKKQGAYVAHIRCAEVRDALQAADRVFVVEGVCLLAVAARCQFTIDTLIYVRRLGASGFWHEEEICLATEPPDDLKEKEVGFFNSLSSSDESNITEAELGLAGELIDYHARHTPVSRADFIFDTVDAPATCRAT